MDADWSVEMGHGDPVLEFPWTSDSPAIKYYDLKRHPELLSSVPEAVEHEPIRHFLAAVNGANSIFQTAKCDVWEELDPDGPSGRVRFCSYVDVLFANRDRQLSFEAHEKLGRDLIAIVDPVDLNDCSAEFIVRRCFYHFEGESHPGLCVTCYVKGFGSLSLDARARWAEALAVVCKALLSEAN